MKSYPLAIEKLIQHFKKIPGVGAKSAERMVFFLLYSQRDSLNDFADALVNLKKDLFVCEKCFSFTQNENECEICLSDFRDKEVICVLENFKDQMVFENLGEYTGLYHVLQGRLSPLDGITPDKLKIKELIDRVEKENIKEVILATSLDMEGDATAYYIAKFLEPFDVNVTRLAKGLPVGIELEFADSLSLSSSLKNREKVQ